MSMYIFQMSCSYWTPKRFFYFSGNFDMSEFRSIEMLVEASDIWRKIFRIDSGLFPVSRDAMRRLLWLRIFSYTTRVSAAILSSLSLSLSFSRFSEVTEKNSLSPPRFLYSCDRRVRPSMK